MTLVSKRAQEFKASPTLALAAKANELKAQGKDIISLTVGEPDWPTYKKAAEAGKQAIDEGKTKYTPASGIPALKTEISKLTQELIGQTYNNSEITVTTGAKFIYFAACQATLDEGDEVIIPAPYWTSYPEMVRLAGGVPKIITTKEENRYKLTASELEGAITNKTKMFLLNSPSNPTGVEYSKKDLAALAEVLKKNPNIVIASDDIYNQLSFSDSGVSPHLLQVAPELKERVVCINGISKAYAMTGWRLGWATGNADIIKAMASYQSQTVGAPCSISQEATVVALRDCKSDVEQTRKTLKERFNYAFDAFSSLPDVQVLRPDGAFYLWFNVSKVTERLGLASAQDLAEVLIDRAGVVAVPGNDFGDSQAMRVSFAISQANLDKAVERIKKVITT